MIAGGIVTKGEVSLKNQVHQMRNDKIVADSRIFSIKQGKVDVQKVEADTECGLILKPALKLEEGDYLQAFKKAE